MHRAAATTCARISPKCRSVPALTCPQVPDVTSGFDACRRVEAQIFGIGADKADGISPSGKPLDIAFFEGIQMILADLQGGRHLGQVLAFALAGLAQILADSLQRRIGLADFVQMHTAAVQSAAAVKRKSCHFGHVVKSPELGMRHPFVLYADIHKC